MGSLLDQIKSTARPTKAASAKTSRTKSRKTTFKAKQTYAGMAKKGKTGKPRMAARTKGAKTLSRS